MSHQDQEMARIRQPGPDDPLTICQNKIHVLAAELLSYVRRDDETPAYFDCDDDTGARTFVCYDVPPKGQTLTTVKVDLERSEAKAKKLEQQLAAERQTVATQKREIIALTDFYNKIKGTELQGMARPQGASPQVSNVASTAATGTKLIKVKAKKSALSNGVATSPDNNDKAAKALESTLRDSPDRDEPGSFVDTNSHPGVKNDDSEEESSSDAEGSEYLEDAVIASDSEMDTKETKKSPNKHPATTAPSKAPKRKKVKVEESQPKTYATSDGDVIPEGKFIFVREVEAINVKLRPFVFEYPENSGKMLVLQCPSPDGCNMSGGSCWFVDNPLYKDFARLHYIAFHHTHCRKRDPTLDLIVSSGSMRVVPDPKNKDEQAMSTEQFKKKTLNINKETKKVRTSSRKWYVMPGREEVRWKGVEKKAKANLGKLETERECQMKQQREEI
ncbi:hypothetical protein PpBr36_04166 [Pyricularia pennisetigena]|uniref:hypothetical protein n=1 Tax=Pyricularia pennisetigena TaxID=1578925 RepID=UPI0011531975|nr:hypothetical protein PpBr36_04166 [Pyricularia pennisetigena]TLS27590.1 hypothetical protein PpBr36_04166 [Pyricularia pennisetigena]